MKLRDNKKLFLTVVALCTGFVLLFSGIIAAIILIAGRNNESEEKNPAYLQMEQVQGVWIASVGNIDFPSKADLTEAELCAELDSIVATVKETGLNTIFFQVRPACDALYKSEIFPVSKYMSSNGTLTVDALEYLIEKAHKEGIFVHAWVNPLRVATGGTVDSLNEKSPARLHPEWCVTYADSKIYFDCAIPQVRDTVAQGVCEIVKNYDVDGIVFDDYFYPYPVYGDDGKAVDFADDESYKEFGADYDTKGDFRRDNVNKLVKLVYDTVKEADENCLFGIAPFGIWKNGYGGEEGSKTAGSQSYYDIYCDTVAFVKGGYVDYIAPQLYWRSEEKAAPYEALCDWWADVTEESGVGLMICHGAYRYGDWESPEGTMKSQVQYAREKSHYCGSVFYGYGKIRDNVCGLKEEIKSLCNNPLTEK